MRSQHHHFRRFWLALVLLALPRLATAQQPSGPEAALPAEATKLFDEGRALADAGDYRAACPKFERSLEFRHGIATLFNLADCYEHLGRTASAYALFTEVAVATRELGQEQRLALARSRRDALESRLSRLQIELQGAPQGIEVTRDGKLLVADQLGTPTPVDPGSREISARAPGKKPWRMLIEIADKPGVVFLTIPVLEDATEALFEAASDEADASGQERPEPTDTVASETLTHASNVAAQGVADKDRGSGSGRSVLTYGLAGLGVVGVAGSVAMGLEFQDNNDKAKTICPSSRNCTGEEIRTHADLVSAASRARTWAIVSGGVGGALLLGASILWLTDGEPTTASAWAPLPFATADGNLGAVMSGSF
jgi:hypothetical protein